MRRGDFFNWPRGSWGRLRVESVDEGVVISVGRNNVGNVHMAPHLNYLQTVRVTRGRQWVVVFAVTLVLVFDFFLPK